MRALLVLALLLPTFALGDVVTRYPSGTSGGAGWTTPSNIGADDGAAASVSISPGLLSSVLYATTFGFDAAIPDGATINSVTLYVEWRASGTNVIGYAGPLAAGLSTTFTITQGPLSITSRSQLLDGVFQVGVQGENITEPGQSRTFYVDFVRVTVDFTPPGADAPRPHVGMW